MKKTQIAVVTALVIGFGWIGASWYTGKKIEAQLQQSLSATNQTLSHLYPGVNLVLDKANYQRGIFSSAANVALYIANTDSSPLVFHATISHGPFPLAQFSKKLFSPAMAVVGTELLATPESQLLFSAAEGKKPIEANTRIDYHAKTDTLINLAALHLQADNLSIYSAGTKVELQYQPEGQALKYAADQKNFAIEFIDNEGIKNKITSAGINFSATSQHNEKALMPNEQYFHSPFISLDVDNHRLLSMKNFNYQTQITSSQQKLNLKLNYQSDELHYLDKLAGNVNIAVSALNIPAEAIGQFILSSRNFSADAHNPPSVLSETNLVSLLKSLGPHPILNLDDFTLTNSKGTSKAELHITGKDLDKLTPTAQPMQSLIQQYVAHAAWNIDINPLMAEDFLKFLHLSDGQLTEDQAQELAVKQLQIFKLAAQMTGLTKLNSEEIKSNLSYDNNSDAVNLNGNTGKLADFIKN